MKKLKPKSTIDEICYPFIYEDSILCDYEILTDELTRMVGWVIAELELLQSQFPNHESLETLKKELIWIQPLCYHLNGSIRGKLAISQEDYDQLLSSYQTLKEQVTDRISGFVLPRGISPIGILNKCCSQCKKSIRLMVRIHNEGIEEVPEILPKFANVLCNYFFTATLVINKTTGHQEIPFESKSY